MPLSAPMPKTAFFAAISCCCCVVSFANAFSFFEWFSNWYFLIGYYPILNKYLKPPLSYQFLISRMFSITSRLTLGLHRCSQAA